MSNGYKYKMRVRTASHAFKFTFLRLLPWAICQFLHFSSLVFIVPMQISAKYFTCPHFCCAYLWQLICWCGAWPLAHKSIPLHWSRNQLEYLKKLSNKQGEVARGGRHRQLVLQLHARAIRWRVDLENKVYLLLLPGWVGSVLALDMSLLDRLASSGCCAAACCLQLN